MGAWRQPPFSFGGLPLWGPVVSLLPVKAFFWVSLHFGSWAGHLQKASLWVCFELKTWLENGVECWAAGLCRGYKQGL